MIAGLDDTLVNTQYDDELVTVILTDLAWQAGWKVQCPESALRMTAHVVFQSAGQAIENVCKQVGWFWRYGSAGSDTLIFAHKQTTMKEKLVEAEQAIRTACDCIDIVSVLDDPEHRDAWYSARHSVETGLGAFVEAKNYATGNDLIGRLFINWKG